MPGNPKLYNTHKFPDATRQPRHLDRLRKESAKERQEAYDKLTLQEKMDRLPATGATKQRARLTALLEKKSQKVVEPQEQTQASPDENVSEKSNKQNNKKKYMKGAK